MFASMVVFKYPKNALLTAPVLDLTISYPSRSLLFCFFVRFRSVTYTFFSPSIQLHLAQVHPLFNNRPRTIHYISLPAPKVSHQFNHPQTSKMKYAIIFGSAVAPLVAAHGMLSSPTPRSAGSAMETACGQQIYNNLAADAFGNSKWLEHFSSLHTYSPDTLHPIQL
jgi:hypothetical protein